MSSEFPPGPGGIGAHAYHLAYQLSQRGYLVHVHTASRLQFDNKEFDLGLPFSITRYLSGRGVFYKIWTSLLFLLKFYRADWAILSGSSQLYLVWLFRLFSRSKLVCIIHGHEVLMVRGVSRLFLRTSLQSSNIIVAVSEFSKNILFKSQINKFVHVIPNGVEVQDHVAENLKPEFGSNRLRLITVGSMTKRKGQHNVINALPVLLKFYSNLEYHIIGMPLEKDALEKLAKKLEVLPYIHFHGAIDNKLKDQYLRNSDIFIMLSENQPNGDVEGFGIAVLEANLLGIPSIGSKDTGIEQAVENGVSGLMVKASEPLEILEAINSIRSHYGIFSKGARAWALKHDWRVIGDQYFDLLQQ